jgi:hypothetical protein
MLWVRGDLSRMELLSVRSFLAHGHVVHLYTYEPPANAPAAVEIFDADAIVPRHLAPERPGLPFTGGTMGSFSDYFRYHLLLARGGWWSDLDVVCLRPWQLDESALTASTEEFSTGLIANGFVLRFPPGHPVAAACVAALHDVDLATVGIDRTGPQLLDSILTEQSRRDLIFPRTVFAPVPWNASDRLLQPFWRFFSPGELKNRLRRPHLSSRFSPATLAVHLWNETWRHAGRDKNAIYPRTCLYERLQRRYNPPAS